MRKNHRLLGIISVTFIFILTITGGLLLHIQTLEKWNDPTALGKIAAIHTLSEQTLLVGTDKGAFVTDGQFEVLKKVRQSPKPVIAIDASPEDKAHLAMVSKYGQLSISKDGGNIWEPVPLPDTLGNIRSLNHLGRELQLITDTGIYHFSPQTGQNTQVYHYKGITKLKQSLIAWHTAYFSEPLKWIYTLVSLMLIYLGISGIRLYFK